ncbi:hypothetical protein GCM10020218_013750 [Dactylosporangium vinaceum]
MVVASYVDECRFRLVYEEHELSQIDKDVGIATAAQCCAPHLERRPVTGALDRAEGRCNASRRIIEILSHDHAVKHSPPNGGMDYAHKAV